MIPVCVGGTMELISDLKDSVFILSGFDLPILPANFPMTGVSMGPHIGRYEYKVVIIMIDV